MRSRILAVAMGLLAACGGKDATGPVNTGNDVQFTRAGGGGVSFSSGAWLYAWCGAWEEGTVPVQSVHVWYGGPSASDPYWHLQAVVADVVVSQPLAFPNSFIWNAPTEAFIFLADPPNKVGTDTQQSSGSITFQALDCSSGGQVRFSVNAVVGSQLGGGPSVTASGTFEGTVGQGPPWLAP